MVKFSFSEKGTKICEIFLMVWVDVQTLRKIAQIFVAFSEKLNFIRNQWGVRRCIHLFLISSLDSLIMLKKRIINSSSCCTSAPCASAIIDNCTFCTSVHKLVFKMHTVQLPHLNSCIVMQCNVHFNYAQVQDCTSARLHKCKTAQDNLVVSSITLKWLSQCQGNIYLIWKI